MRVLTCMGGVWKISERAYKELLTFIVENPGVGFDLDKVGTYVGSIDKDVTDMTAAEAKEELDSLQAKQRAARESQHNA